jgi:hypothetical protein
MNKRKIKELLPEPQHSKEQKADGTSVSPAIAKPNVGCCTSMQTLKKNILKSEILSDNTKIIVGAFIDIQLEYEQEQLINTFKDAQALHAMGNDMRAEQYFNNTFK